MGWKTNIKKSTYFVFGSPARGLEPGSICRVAGNHRALTNHSIVSHWSVIGRIHCLGELIFLGKEKFFADEFSEEISHFERSTPPKS